jgi:hypothetical protein
LTLSVLLATEGLRPPRDGYGEVNTFAANIAVTGKQFVRSAINLSRDH